MSNYPDGTWAGDPNAPWNAPDPEPLVCNGCGYEDEDDSHDGDDCPNCEDGTLCEREPTEPCRCTGDACYC